MTSKYVNFKTPKGIAKFPKLDRAYTWSNSQNKSVPDPDGQFEVHLVMPKDRAAPLIATIKEAIAQSGIKPKNVPYKDEIDRETDEPTGNIEFKFKAYGKKKDGSKNVIKLWDAKARPAPGVKVAGGSEIKINGYISVAKLGARLNMNEIQIINLAASSSGFEPEEDGYEYDEADNNNKNNFDDETNEAPEEDDTDF